MTTGNIRLLEDKQGVPFFPLTHPDAVVDENGMSVSEHLTDIVKYSIKSFKRQTPEANDNGRLQRAINACINKTLLIDEDLIISNTITISNPLRLIGKKYEGAIYLDPNFPNDKDVFELTPSVLGQEVNEFENLFVIPQSGTPGRDILRIIFNPNKGTNGLKIKECYFRALGGGKAINALNGTFPSTGVNPDGVAMLHIEKNTLYGGIHGENIGDSCKILWNNIKGKNIGIDISMVNDSYGSASTLEILGNNIVSDDGAIRLTNCRNFHVKRNNIEQITELLNGYIIKVQNSLPSSYSTIEENKIEAKDPIAKVSCILVENCKNIKIANNQGNSSSILDSNFESIGKTFFVNVKSNSENIIIKENDIYVSKGCTGISIDSSSKNVRLGINEYSLYDSNSQKVEDNGIGTSGVLKYDNTWSAETEALTYIKNDDGLVTIKGVIVPQIPVETVPVNTAIASMPIGFRPYRTEFFLGMYMDTNGVWHPTPIVISNDGSVLTQANLTNFLRLSIQYTFTTQ